MSFIRQKAYASGTVVTFAQPTLAHSLIVLVATWTELLPSSQFLEFYDTPTPNRPFDSNTVDDGGNSYCPVNGGKNTFSTRILSCLNSNPCQSITLNPHRWQGAVDNGAYVPVTLRVRAYEVTNVPYPGSGITPQEVTNVQWENCGCGPNCAGDGYGTADLTEGPSATPAETVLAANWSDSSGSQAFMLAVLGPGADDGTSFAGSVSAVASPWTLDDPQGITAVALLDTDAADSNQTATFAWTYHTNGASLWEISLAAWEVSGTPPPSCTLDIAPATLSFSAEQGTTPASQSLSVTNALGLDPIDFTTTPSASWISVAPSGTSPQSVTVNINTAGLSEGTYNGTIVFSSACNDVTIDLTLTVTPPPPPPPEDEPCVEPTGCPFTLGDGVEALGQRLYDPSHQFWTAPELTRYIVESLRTWNALASYWRDEFVFDAASAGDGFGAGGFGSGGFGGVGGPANTWIDLTVPPTSLRPLTVTDQYLLEVIEYHLLEPLTSTFPLTWTGSRQFSVVDLQSALQRRRDETLGVTGCFITRLIVPSLPGRIALPNKVIELRRVAFLPDQNVVDLPLVVPMFQDDQWALQAFRQSFTTDPFELPRIWAQSTEPYVAGPTGPQLSFDVNPLPGTPGEYEVLVIQSGGILCESAASTSTIPDDWTWVAKFGALADLMSRESNAKDSLRAKYAEGRYRQGLALLASSPALLTMRVNNLPLQIDAIKSADEYQTTWETLSAQAQPMMALTAGLNLVALSPPPDAPNGVERAITAGVVRNAPVPVELTDCIQVGRDLWDVIIDYAQHLAAIKMGGAEFIATAPLYDRFMKAASLYNSKLKEMGQFRDLLYNRSQLEPAMNPRYTLDGDPANG